ncbi:MAG TPA: DUF6596 domain-containing protein [Propionibacteriaceae bacterium]|nr:DUF6596 domain-containing protein [Propionibacteriaceae bacterium]
MTAPDIEDLLRELAPQVLGALVRRYGHFDACEEATQEALLAAALQWPGDLPNSPRGWLITVASRRLIDLLRADQSRSRREQTVAQWTLPEQWVAPPADARLGEGGHSDDHYSDDTLVLLFLCCHPALSAASQIALTLRAVGGLTTGEIARAFLVPEATMTRRITRAKQAIRASGAAFALPPGDAQAERLAAVLHVLYLIFTEGYAATSGPSLLRPDLSAEAIRLTRVLQRLVPHDSEVAGLLAMMLLTEARAAARTDEYNSLVPLAEQDRSLYRSDLVAEGVALITEALPRGATGPYQLQAAIAAIHAESPSAAETDWAQIAALYALLLQIADNPVVALNHAVAVAMSEGPTVGLDLLTRLEAGKRVVSDHRLPAVRAHMLELTGDRDGARRCYLAAAARALGPAQQRYLLSRAARLQD